MSVQDHYARDGILDRILEALRADGADLNLLSERDLRGIDELHSRSRLASEELLATVDFRTGMRILDVGCGVGGPARRLARHGLSVDGIDVTPEFVHVATELTRRSGLEALASFRVADALDLPFEADSFDGVWLQHVTMNVEAKTRLFAELARVLKRGGRVALHEVLAGPTADPIFPVPWAPGPELSFLRSEADYLEAIGAASLGVSKWKDDTETTVAFFDEATTRQAVTPARVGPAVLFGRAFPAAIANYHQSLREGRCRVVLGTLTKP